MRDKALPSAMLFSFARVGAVVMMRVRDFDDEASDAWLVLSEMGGKSRRLPAHHLVRESQRACVAAAELEARSRELLFQSFRVRHVSVLRSRARPLVGRMCGRW